MIFTNNLCLLLFFQFSQLIAYSYILLSDILSTATFALIQVIVVTSVH